MKKRIISAICICMALILTAGCGKSDKATSNSPKKNNSSSVATDNSSSSANSEVSNPSSNSNASSSAQGTKTVVSTIPKRERTESSDEEVTASSKYALENDTTIKNEKKLGKYEYVWGDEFDGNSLDRNKWELQISDSTADVLQTEDNVEYGGGTVKLWVKRYYDPFNNTQKWSNAPSLITRHTMNYSQGYLEMRAIVPFRQGFWPAFWTVSNKDQLLPAKDWIEKYGWGTETDIFEIFGSKSVVTPNLHVWYQDGTSVHKMAKYKTKYEYENFSNLNNEYHIYGFEWTETEMSMYVDGEKYNTFYFKDNAPKQSEIDGFSQPVYVIINNGPITPENRSNDGMGLPRVDEDGNPSDIPGVFSIDWVRLYQEPGKGMFKSK